jgi:hypothetical protein
VTPAAELLADPQLPARGFWETVQHPVAGTFLCTGMPFAFLGRPRRWIRRVPPLDGRHTAEVLKGVLGRDDDDLAALREAGATSARPARSTPTRAPARSAPAAPWTALRRRRHLPRRRCGRKPEGDKPCAL